MSDVDVGSWYYMVLIWYSMWNIKNGGGINAKRKRVYLLKVQREIGSDINMHSIASAKEYRHPFDLLLQFG